jgi:hypothetical protein
MAHLVLLLVLLTTTALGTAAPAGLPVQQASVAELPAMGANPTDAAGAQSLPGGCVVEQLLRAELIVCVSPDDAVRL